MPAMGDRTEAAERQGLAGAPPLGRAQRAGSQALARSGRASAALLRLEHGREASVARARDDGAVRVVLPCPPLVGGAPAGEEWQAAGRVPAPVEAEDGLVVARTRAVLAGAVTFRGDDLECEVTRAYRAVLALLEREQVHLVRAWNAVPDIGGAVREGARHLDRYMLFCRARSLALAERLGPRFPAHLSAASAVGAAGARGGVAFLAAREPGHAVSNPRQEEAWRYPPRYGPRAPSFARATRLGDALGGWLLVSGTASIVGSASRHAHDAEAQLEETLSNLAALLVSAGADARRPLHSLRRMRVYVKDPSLRARLQPRLRAVLAERVEPLWARATICRPELVVEIEGVAR